MNEYIRKNEEVQDGELETVSGGESLLAHAHSGLAENEANAQNNMPGSAASGTTCPKCGFRMHPTVPIQGIVTSAPGFVCTTCGYTR